MKEDQWSDRDPGKKRVRKQIECFSIFLSRMLTPLTMFWTVWSSVCRVAETTPEKKTKNKKKIWNSSLTLLFLKYESPKWLIWLMEYEYSPMSHRTKWVAEVKWVKRESENELRRNVSTHLGKWNEYSYDSWVLTFFTLVGLHSLLYKWPFQ